MKERIDKFMKAAREKYIGNALAWENLYRELKELTTGDYKTELTCKWSIFMQEPALNKWDDKFTELLINGEIEIKGVSGTQYTNTMVGVGPIKTQQERALEDWMRYTKDEQARQKALPQTISDYNALQEAYIKQLGLTKCL